MTAEDTLIDIYAYFERPIRRLNHPETMAYLAWLLLNAEKTDCYPTHCIEALPQYFPANEVSDTILYAALRRLEAIGAVSYQRQKQARGRPRKLYSLNNAFRHHAQALSNLWVAFQTDQRSGSIPEQLKRA